VLTIETGVLILFFAATLTGALSLDFFRIRVIVLRKVGLVRVGDA
jgi:hypothetical protein